MLISYKIVIDNILLKKNSRKELTLDLTSIKEFDKIT